MKRRNYLSIDRRMSGGRYADILDAAGALADECGSAVNALAAMARQSRLYADAMSRLAREKRRQRLETAAQHHVV